jgi:hypothetical protein
MIRALDVSTSSDDLVNAASFVPKPIRYTAFHDANQNGLADPPNESTSIDQCAAVAGIGGESRVGGDAA